MSAYLLTWNPSRWLWEDLTELAVAVRAGKRLVWGWSTGNTRSIPIGARVFLLRQHDPPLGIIASGWVVEGSYQDLHWDDERAKAGDVADYIDFVPDVVLDPAEESPLNLRDLPRPEEFEVYFHSARSGITILPHHHEQLETWWARHTGNIQDSSGSDEFLEELEGKLRVRMMVHRSRERILRKAKIDTVLSRDLPLRCEVPGCGFDFEGTYGALGHGYAQVHHLIPLSEGPRQTRLEDLAIVCANCHVMIHRGGKSRKLSEVRIKKS